MIASNPRTTNLKTLADDVTGLLEKARSGDREAVNRLHELVYDQLRQIAHRQRLQWQGEETLNTTALVHEAYIRMADGAPLDFQSRVHFLRIAAKAMRYVLLDKVKAQRRQKRGGDRQRVPLDEGMLISEEEAGRFLALNEALERLEANNTRYAQIVECRFFGEMTIDETAAALSISPATVKRGWTMARAWLFREMGAEQDASA